MNETPNVFKAITDSVSDGIVLIDRDYKITYANAAAHRVFGINNGIRGLTCHDFFHRLPTPCNINYEFKRCPHAEVFKTGKPVSIRYPFILKTGEKRIFDITATPVMDNSNNKVDHIVKILKDITFKTQTENMLKEAETKYQNLLDNALIGVYKTNIKGHIFYVNKALADMLEFNTPEEMIKCSVLLLYDKLAQREGLIRKLMEAGNVSNYEVDLLTKRGKIKHVLISANLEGDVLSGMIMDVTDQKTMGELTKKQELFFSSILEGMQDGMVVVNRNFEIIYANSSYIKQTKTSASEIMGRHCFEVSHRNTRPCYLVGEECSVKNAFDTGASSKIIHTHFNGNSSKINVETVAYPLRDLSGNIVSVVERVCDITEKIELENELIMRVRELETFYEMAVGRELRMIELKNEIEALKTKSSKHDPGPIS
ncbi:MAG: PAS domain-containing protein [Nitrospirae bacterium]|nr:PAS domain-containing protein [Nitrospirota bacterium]